MEEERKITQTNLNRIAVPRHRVNATFQRIELGAVRSSTPIDDCAAIIIFRCGNTTCMILNTIQVVGTVH